MCTTVDKTIDMVAQGLLFAPRGFLNTPASQLEKMSNGCGSENALFDFIPDTNWGECIGATCIIHDYMYTVGHTIYAKEEADRVLLNNNLRIIERVTGWRRLLKILMRRRALKMYEVVHVFGGPAFWADKD